MHTLDCFHYCPIILCGAAVRTRRNLLAFDPFVFRSGTLVYFSIYLRSRQFAAPDRRRAITHLSTRSRCAEARSDFDRAPTVGTDAR